jgi:hypothetical protein
MHLFNRFMMKSNNIFFSLSKEKQDEYKIKNQENLEFPLKKFMYKELLNVEFENENDYDDLEISEEILLQMNMNSNYLRGIGENYFYLNECFDKEDMLTFKTLYDYDLDHHNYQEKAFSEHSSTPTTIEPYRMRLNFRWARGFLNEEDKNDEIKNNFYYFTLTSLAFHIYEEISVASSDYINKLIPYEYVEGKNHGKKEKGGSIFDYRTSANGLEEQLDELKSRSYTHLSELYTKIQKEFDDNKKNTIWCIDKSTKNDPSKYYIFSDQNVIKEIRFAHWQKDTEKFIADDTSILDDIITKETKDVFKFLDKEYKDIMNNHDPKIKKFKKKMNVIISDDAINNLSKISTKKDDDDE